MPRRKTKLKELLQLCESCNNFPLSQRHHLLKVSEYGENNFGTAFICPNCHWLLHVCIDAHFKQSKSAIQKWQHSINYYGENSHIVKWIVNKMLETQELYFEQYVNINLLD